MFIHLPLEGYRSVLERLLNMGEVLMLDRPLIVEEGGRIDNGRGRLRNLLFDVVGRVLLDFPEEARWRVLGLLSGKAGAVHQEFPQWRSDAFMEVRIVFESVINLIQEFGERCPAYTEVVGRIIESLERKFGHPMGAVCAYTQFFTNSETGKVFCLARAIGLLEILQGDILDTLGDECGVREPTDSRRLYTLPIVAFQGKGRFNLIGLSNSLARELGEWILYPLYREAKATIVQILGRLDTEVQALVRGIGGWMIADYGRCIEVMHIQNRVEQKVAALDFLEEAVRTQTERAYREIPQWLRYGMLWYLAHGSTLGPHALLMEAVACPYMTRDDAFALARFYDLEVPLLHLLLDDIGDVTRDQEAGDPNLVLDIQEGRLDQTIALMARQYDLDPRFRDYANSERLRLLAFADLLARAYLEKEQVFKESLGEERAGRHIQVIHDLLHFYFCLFQGDDQEYLYMIEHIIEVVKSSARGR